jgi:hypothetical protein
MQTQEPDFRSMSYGQMRRWADRRRILVASSTLLSDDRKGVYDNRNHVILLDRGMDYTAKRCTFVHEYVHWQYNDPGCGSLLGTKAENRAKLLTARMLISPVEYAMAEEMYEGDPYRIANELDVTYQVVCDYRDWLNSLPKCDTQEMP